MIKHLLGSGDKPQLPVTFARKGSPPYLGDPTIVPTCTGGVLQGTAVPKRPVQLPRGSERVTVSGRAFDIVCMVAPQRARREVRKHRLL